MSQVINLSYNYNNQIFEDFDKEKFYSLIENILSQFSDKQNDNNEDTEERKFQGGNIFSNVSKETIKKNIPKIINMLFYGLIIIIVLLLILYLYNKYKVINYKFHKVKDFEDKKNNLNSTFI